MMNRDCRRSDSWDHRLRSAKVVSVRSLAALGLAVALLATLVALLAPPLQAQTTTPVTLISSDLSGPVFDYGIGLSYAVKFRTGGGVGDYTITAIRLPLGSSSGTNANATVRLREDSGGQPGDLVGEPFARPTALTSTGLNTFTAPAGTLLAKDTTYWFTLNEEIGSGGLSPRGLLPANRNVTSDHGWTLIGGHSTRGFTISGQTWFAQTSPLLFEIRGIGIPKSTDATLSGLELENASNGDAIALDPAFSAGHFDYAASVGFPVSRITVLPTKNDAGASIRYRNDSNDVLTDLDTNRPGFQVDLLAGEQNVIKVEVTAQDGTTPATYTLTVTRAGRPAQVLLSEKVLSLTEGSTRYYTVVLSRRPASDVTVTVAGDVGTEVNAFPQTLTFSTTNWSQAQRMFVSTSTDPNLTNESVRLTHEAASLDSLFDGITIPDLVVNVDDAEAPDRHIRTVSVPAGSHALPFGEKLLPEEKITVFLGLGVDEDAPDDGTDDVTSEAKYLEVVAEGHVWQPSGLWGDPGRDTIWVVDPSHFGIHPLKLSALKDGRIERHIPTLATDGDFRFNYNCHFSPRRVGGLGNPALTVIWGDDNRIWVANDNPGRLDAYARTAGARTRDDDCYVENVTGYDSNGNSTSTIRHLESRLGRVPDRDIQIFANTIRGIWATASNLWYNGPPSGMLIVNLSTGQTTLAPGYDGHEYGHGLWSDGTTMWVAAAGWLRAYDLDTGNRAAEFDIRIRTYSMPPGDIWSHGGTIWVTNRGGEIDAYRLRPPGPITAAQRERRRQSPSRLVSPWRRRRMTGRTGSSCGSPSATTWK